MAERRLAADVAAAFADDDSQFTLVVEIVGNLGSHDIGAMRYQRAVQAQEHARLFRQLATHLEDVTFIIDTDTDDLFRIRHRRQQRSIG